jgi:hypothetical protein
MRIAELARTIKETELVDKREEFSPMSPVEEGLQPSRSGKRAQARQREHRLRNAPGEGGILKGLAARTRKLDNLIASLLRSVGEAGIENPLERDSCLGAARQESSSKQRVASVTGPCSRLQKAASVLSRSIS